jgi:hypothetical protein
MATRKRRKTGKARKLAGSRGKKVVAKKRPAKKAAPVVSLTAVSAAHVSTTAALGAGMKVEVGSFVSPSPGVTGVEMKAEAGDFVPKPPQPNFGWWSPDDASIQIVLQEAARRRAFVAQLPFSSMPPLPLRSTIPDESKPGTLNTAPLNTSLLNGLEQGQSVTLDTNVIRAADRPAILHQEVLKRIAELEDLIKKLPETTPGIGHNRSPEPIEQTPVTPSELLEIKTILREIKSLPAIPTQQREIASNAANTLNKISSRIWKCADDILTGASMAAGAAIVAGVIPANEKFNIWHLFSALLSSLAQAISEWLTAIPALY